MSTNLIKDREERTKKRKKAKEKFDSIINLSITKNKEESVLKLSARSKNQTVRLLDEGLFTYADGSPYFYITKGALKAFYDELSDDYVGSINLGHMSFESFPFIIGEWAKKDLTLVDIGDGRQALDVKLNLDENSIFVKELRKQDYTVGVSAEFFYEIDWDSTERLRLEVINKVNIKDFAIVGDVGNVNSAGIKLKGGNKDMAFLDELFKKKKALEAEKEVEQEEKGEGEEETTLEDKLKAIDEAMEGNEEAVELMSAAESLNAELQAKLDAETKRADEAEAKLASAEKSINNVYSKFTSLSSKFLSDTKKDSDAKKKALEAEVKQEKKMLSTEELEELKSKTNGFGEV